MGLRALEETTMVVAIDGPAGVGKSSVAAWVSREYGFFNLNSGAFYRAMALKVLDEKIDPENHREVRALASTVTLDIADKRLRMNGQDVEDRLRNDDVDRASSIVSSIVEVRHLVNCQLRRVAGFFSLVAEGRDMGSVVFPDAELKIYLDAHPSVRALRRFNQGMSTMSLAELENAIRERDYRDRNKAEGSLMIADDAHLIDSSDLTLQEVYARVAKLIEACL